MKSLQDYIIRKANALEWEPAMELAWETFKIYQTKEYTQEGIESFYDFIHDKDLKKMFMQGFYKMFLAFDGTKIIGLITLRNGCHISLLFIDKAYQKQGVGSSLIKYLSDYLYYKEKIRYVTVDAAPNAVEFYHKTGFWDLAPLQYRQGISFVPMKKNL